ncbi:MAG: chalcone isomerase family protein [Myxococcota bacterium]
MLLALALTLAHAATLAGVTLPDTATVGGTQLSLNGMGLREKYTIDVYVAGLYLRDRTHDGAAAIEADAPKRVVMRFVYRKVTKQQMIDTFREGFGDAADGPQKANVERLVAALPAEVFAGDEMVFDYVPGVGTTVTLQGRTLATVPGTEFMRMVFGTWLGPKPPSAALKAGMLGL